MEQQVAKMQPFYLQLSHFSMHIWHDSLQEPLSEVQETVTRKHVPRNYDDTPEESVTVSMYVHG